MSERGGGDECETPLTPHSVIKGQLSAPGGGGGAVRRGQENTAE